MKLTGSNEPNRTNSPNYSGISEEGNFLSEILAPFWLFLPQVYYFTLWVIPSDWGTWLERKLIPPYLNESGRTDFDILFREKK